MIRLALGGQLQVETQLLDEHLSWNMRIGELISKTSEKLGILRRMRDNLTVYSANAMYNYIFYLSNNGVLLHGVELLQSLQQFIVREINTIHAARIITKERRSDDAMVKLKWPLLEDTKHIHKFVWKGMTGFASFYYI